MLTRVLKRGETSGRVDDNVEVFKKRFEGYQKEASGIVELFGDRIVRVSKDVASLSFG